MWASARGGADERARGEAVERRAAARGGGVVIRVIVASASAVARAGLEALVAADAELSVAGGASDLDSLARLVEALQPDVVVLDFESETEEAVNSIQATGGDAPPVEVVALAADARGAWVAEALRSGLRAVLPRDAQAGAIRGAIRAVAAGLVVLHPEVFEALRVAPSAPDQDPSSTAASELTPREQEVLAMLSEGLGNKTIAYRLGISEHTVKFHVASIFSKLGVGSRTEAVTAGVRRGIIML